MQNTLQLFWYYTQIYMCKHRLACRAVLPFQDVVKLDLQAIDSCDDILPVLLCCIRACCFYRGRPRLGL